MRLSALDFIFFNWSSVPWFCLPVYGLDRWVLMHQPLYQGFALLVYNSLPCIILHLHNYPLCYILLFLTEHSNAVCLLLPDLIMVVILFSVAIKGTFWLTLYSSALYYATFPSCVFYNVDISSKKYGYYKRKFTHQESK